MVVYVDTHLKQVSTTGTHTTGAGVGASGFYKNVVKAMICGTEVLNEVMDTGDGGTLGFSGTLAHFPVGLRRLIVHYTISSTPYTATDDGSGLITGTHCSGTIDHTTGDWTLTFAGGFPPDNMTDITGDYLYGNPGADWRIMYERNSRKSNGADESFAAACKETILHNTGISGTEDVYIGFREWDYTAVGALGWDTNGYVSYTPNMDWNANKVSHGLTAYGATWKHWTNLPMMPMSNSSFTYWVWSNRQRIIIATQFSTYYLSMYLGFGRRYGQISSYPCPMVVKAPLYGDTLYTTSPTYLRFIADNGAWSSGGTGGDTYGYSLLCVGPSNSYLVCGGLANGRVKMIPRNSFAIQGTDVFGRTMTALRTPVRPVYLVEYILTPSYLPEKLLMDLDGVYWTFGNPLAAQDVISFDNTKHLVLPDANRSAWYDFMAISDKYITTTS